MRKEELRHKILRGIYNYLMFFLLVAFLVSCSTMLFISVMADTLNMTLTRENIGVAAKVTFCNVIFLSVLFTVIDAIRRKFTTEKITSLKMIVLTLLKRLKILQLKSIIKKLLLTAKIIEKKEKKP